MPGKAQRLARVPQDIAKWLASILYHHSGWNALDAFLIQGETRFEIDPVQLPVPVDQLAGFCAGLRGVWVKPFGDAFGGEHHVRVDVIPKETNRVEIKIQCWSGRSGRET